MKKWLSGILCLVLLAASLTAPAFAANLDVGKTLNLGQGTTYTQAYGVSVETAISSVSNTIATVNSMRKAGTLDSTMLKILATHLYSLESAAKANGEIGSGRIAAIINSAEEAIEGLTIAGEVEVAIAVIRESLGLDGVTVDDGVTVENNKSSAVNQTVAFDDVDTTHWAYAPIMAMVADGLFKGTDQVGESGLVKFLPENTMSRAEFVTVITRYLYADDLKQLESERDGTPAYWYSNNYIVAVENGLISGNEFSEQEMGQAMTRQEMAMVLVRAAEQKGEVPEQLVSTLRIPDFNQVGTYYQNYVRKCYSMGLIIGTDKGTFEPTTSMSRAQAATVIYRLLEPSTRQEVDFSTPTTSPSLEGVMTIYEGQYTQRPARAGDIFVKADGTQVVLQIGPNGILGEGQGVAPDQYLKGNSGRWTDARFNFTVAKDGDWVDSTGKTLQNNRYLINETTGEGHWMNEWMALEDVYPEPTTSGTYNGQISTDPYSLWRWHTMSGTWIVNSTDLWAYK